MFSYIELSKDARLVGAGVADIQEEIEKEITFSETIPSTKDTKLRYQLDNGVVFEIDTYSNRVNTPDWYHEDQVSLMNRDSLFYKYGLDRFMTLDSELTVELLTEAYGYEGCNCITCECDCANEEVQDHDEFLRDYMITYCKIEA